MTPRDTLAEVVTCILPVPRLFWFHRLFTYLFHDLSHLHPKLKSPCLVVLIQRLSIPFFLTVDLVHMFSNPAITFLWWRSRAGSWQETDSELHGIGITLSFILYSFPSNLWALSMLGQNYGFVHHWVLIWCFHGTIHFHERANSTCETKNRIKSINLKGSPLC